MSIDSFPQRTRHFLVRMEYRMQGYQFKTKSLEDIPADTRRGGAVHTLLSPKTVGSTSGFMGVATIGSGEKIKEHYHPYSEEFIYVVRGKIVAQLDSVPCNVQA